jgi:hypothetical protein
MNYQVLLSMSFVNHLIAGILMVQSFLKLGHASAYLACALIICACFAACNPSTKNPILGMWKVRAASADPKNRTPEGLASRVWAETVSAGATWEFRPDDSAIVTFPPDKDKRFYHYTLAPDGKSMVLNDQVMHKIDTLDVHATHDSLYLFDRTRNINYVMTYGAVKLEDYP